MSPAHTHDVHRGSLPFPRSLPEFQRLFPDDAACAAYLERCRWPELFRCPSCGKGGDPFRFAARPGVLRCRACRKDTSLTAGTIMHRTHSPLSTWFWAAYMVDHGGTVALVSEVCGCALSSAQEMLAHMRVAPVHQYRGWPRLRARLGLHGEPRAKGPKPSPVATRFWPRTKTGPVPPHRPELGTCLNWTGTISRGYGVLTINAQTEHAHRVAWYLAHGEWPDQCVLHACDNRQCVRIEHLFLGDRPDNTADMLAKRRGTPPKLTPAQVEAIAGQLAVGIPGYQLAAEYGVSSTTVSSIRKGKYGRAHM